MRDLEHGGARPPEWGRARSPSLGFFDLGLPWKERRLLSEMSDGERAWVFNECETFFKLVLTESVFLPSLEASVPAEDGRGREASIDVAILY